MKLYDIFGVDRANGIICGNTILYYCYNVEKLCGIIERWKLTKWDVKASGSSDSVVKVSIDDLHIRKSAGTNTAKTGRYTGKGVFTIVEVKSGKGSDTGWGRLKSGAGWISLDYCQRV